MRPLADPDNDDDDDQGGARLSLYQPRDDTLIEREIRITRQREGSLRRVRGYPAITGQQAPVEVPLSGFGRQLQAQPAPPGGSSGSPVTSPRSPGAEQGGGGGGGPGPANEDVAMRRLATNRLRLEILRERKREVDLRSQGKIYTISEEHIERPPLLAELVAATSPRRTPSPRAAAADHGAQESAAVAAAGVVNSDGRHRSARQQQQQQQQQQHGRPLPHDDTGRRRLVGEKLIEQEVRELRRREQELRSAYKLLLQ